MIRLTRPRRLSAFLLPLIQSSRLFTCGFTPPDYLIDGLLAAALPLLDDCSNRRGQDCRGPASGGGHSKGREHIQLCKGPTRRVLISLGENRDDIRMRWLAMADKLAFDVDDIDAQFIAGVIVISSVYEYGGDIAAEGGVTAVVVQTQPSPSGGDDETDNVQMGKHARVLRRLTTGSGGPRVPVRRHPTKNVSNHSLLPRGGGAFVAELDGQP